MNLESLTRPLHRIFALSHCRWHGSHRSRWLRVGGLGLLLVFLFKRSHRVGDRGRDGFSRRCGRRLRVLGRLSRLGFRRVRFPRLGGCGWLGCFSPRLGLRLPDDAVRRAPRVCGRLRRMSLLRCGSRRATAQQHDQNNQGPMPHAQCRSELGAALVERGEVSGRTISENMTRPLTSS